MHYILEEKCVEGEATPLSRNEDNESAPRVRALNGWRLKESLINDFPAPLNQKIVNQEKLNSTTRQYKTTRM